MQLKNKLYNDKHNGIMYTISVRPQKVYMNALYHAIHYIIALRQLAAHLRYMI